MFVPSYLFLDFVFILFLTLGWRRSQHSLVWMPTPSHQRLLKAQKEPAAPAGARLGEEVLVLPLRPRAPGAGRRGGTAVGPPGGDFLPAAPLVVPQQLRPSCGACSPSAPRTSSPAPSRPPLWSSESAPRLCTSAQGKAENAAEQEAHKERVRLLSSAGYCRG